MNVRLSYADVNNNGSIEPASEILEENNYYPFGLKHRGYNELANANRSEQAEKYQYNGKEWNDALGLNIYEMDLRQYDPAVGRWTVQDPVIHHEFSPYSAFDNNPVYWADPSGADAITWIDSEGNLLGATFTGTDAMDAFLFLTGQSSADFLETLTMQVYEFDDIDDSGGGGGGGNGGGNRQKTGLPLLYDVWKSGLSSFTMSDTWNSPLARLAVPDKISFGLSQSATAYFGFNKGLFFEFIIRGHDANLVPYVTFTVGGQLGPKLNADALIVFSRGYYAVNDMRNLEPGQAARDLLGWSLNADIGFGQGFGGALGGSYGFQSWGSIYQPTWISISGGLGASMGGGVTGGVNYTFPVSESKFNF